MTAPRWQAFLADLKRRRVFRLTAVYGGAAFVMMQVADLVFPRLGLPDWTITLVVALAVVGFPVAIATAWTFETGPAGLRRTEPATTGELMSIIEEPRSHRWPAGLAALAGVALLGAGVWWTTSSARGASSYDSIAILPFANLSGDPENEYFGDGLAEELLNALAGIDGLKVAARTSAFSFKGKDVDVRLIGDTLDVATVLEGSVRRSADRIRITAQLIDARSGYHLWSDTYDRPLTELFAVQDAIAAEIVDALSISLMGTDVEATLYRGGTTDLEAYDLYLLGRQKWATRQIPLLRQAVEHFEQAIARDSGFALAWSGLADAIDALAWRRQADALARVGDAKDAALRSVLLEPELAEGWASMGVLLTEFDRDLRFSELALRRAIDLKPSYASAYLWLGNALLYSGRAMDALEPSLRTVELDPLSPLSTSSLAHAQLALRRWAEARDTFLLWRRWGYASQSTPAVRLLVHARSFGFSEQEAATYAREWAALAGAARPEEAVRIARGLYRPGMRASARDVLRSLEADGVPLYDLAQLRLALGDAESAMSLLERAFQQGDPVLIQLGIDPGFDGLREDPRFQELTDALGVPNGVAR